MSLSAQKFISDLSRDAFHFAKLRVNGTTAGRGRPATAVDRNRVVLTMDDLSLALSEHGVNVKKPDYCEPQWFHRADEQISSTPIAISRSLARRSIESAVCGKLTLTTRQRGS